MSEEDVEAATLELTFFVSVFADDQSDLTHLTTEVLLQGKLEIDFFNRGDK